jgi:hypothetical protein
MMVAAVFIAAFLASAGLASAQPGRGGKCAGHSSGGMNS